MTESATATARKVRILIADDDRLVRMGLVAILDSDPDLEIVAQTPDGRTAVDAIERHDVDVALLDIQMPQLDGIQTLREIRRRKPRIPIAMLTTFSDDHLIEDALGAGALGFLLKSDEPQQLILGVRALADGGGSFSPRVSRWLAGRERISQRAATSLLELRKSLTSRQLDLLANVGKGLSNAEIAATMHLSEGTVKQYVSQLLDSLGVGNRVHAAVIAFRSGLLH